MPKTLGTLLTDVRSRLDETAARFWTDVEIRRWLNDAARDVARRTESLQTTTPLAFAANDQSKTLPGDCIRVHRVEWRATSQDQIYVLEFRDYNGMDQIWATSQVVTKGYPSHYTMWGYPPSLTLLVYPTPSTGGTVKVFYYRLPADLATDGSADGQNLDIPEGWHDALVLNCEYIALRKDGDRRWQEAKTLYEERIDDLLTASRRWADAAGSISQSGIMGTLPAWLYSYD